MGTSPDGVITRCAVFFSRAASVILTHSSAESTLRDWGLELREQIGLKRAAVAVARKLGVIMHAMLKSGALFDKTAGAPA
jgi:transposase